MEKIYKYYKSEQSYLNQQGFFRLCYNQIRKDKSTTKFTKVKTSGYNSLLEEMYEYNNNEYICAGLNSFEREVVVVDNDDESFGKTTMNSLKSLGLVPHCQKIKPNGHSQTYFFIDKYKIGAAGFLNGKYWENDDFENHEKWKRLTKMMNYLFNGDLGYTGYNCQNPLYINANVTSYKNITQRYSFDELYNFCLDKMSDIENLDEFLKKMRKISMTSKKTKITSKDIEVVIIFKDKQAIHTHTTSSIITNDTLSEIDVEATIDNAITEQEKYINERIFISCCRTCKSFKLRSLLSFDNFDYISRTCYKDFTKNDYADGYTSQCLIDRIRADVRQIIYNDKLGKMNWEKVGYTNEQRELSLKIRKDKHQIKLHTIQSIITNDTLSCREISRKYEEITGEKISKDTVSRILKEIKENEIEKKEEPINLHTIQSIITNDTVDTNYIEDLASLALQIGEKENEEIRIHKNEKNLERNAFTEDNFFKTKYA